MYRNRRKTLKILALAGGVALILIAGSRLMFGTRSAEAGMRELVASQKFTAGLREEQSKHMQQTDIQILATRTAEKEGDSITVMRGIGDASLPVLSWNGEEGRVSWDVDIPETGVYHIDFKYYPLPGRDGAIERKLLIDGKSPLPGAGVLSWGRNWVDNGDIYKDNKGNEMAPSQIEKPEWKWATLQDPQHRIPGPLNINLAKGKHKITLVAVREPVAIEAIRIYSAETVPAYADVQQSYRSKGYTAAETDPFKIQAEKVSERTDPVIHATSDANPFSEPQSLSSLKLNTVGGYAWRQPGQSASWTFTVAESGLYQIGTRYGQFFHRGMPSFRSIRIDGQFPFQEMQLYAFPYERLGKEWDFQWFTDGKSAQPFQFYLEKGEHTISMDVELGPLGEAMTNVEDIVRRLGELQRQITSITGAVPDPNLDYEIAKRIPTLLPDMKKIVDQLNETHMQLVENLGADPKSSQLDTLRVEALTLKSLYENADKLPNRLDQMIGSQSSLASWLLSTSESPLQLDYFLIAPPGAKAPKASPGLYTQLKYGLHHFNSSFSSDYNNVGSTFDGKTSDKVLNVWVGRGRSWAEVMKRLIDEDFTRNTGIRVNVNTFPTGDTHLLMLSSASGSTPDVALGVPNSTPVDYAVRGALYDLRSFADYDDIAKRFRKGALIPFAYNAGAYAIPETQDFNILFYRKDILEQYGLQVPQTWDDVYKLLPTLQRKGMSFGYPFSQSSSTDQNLQLSGFSTFLFQRAGDFYKDNGTRSALTSPDAIAAFKDWTRLYSSFRVPQEIDFYNRFRIGDIPLGVSNFNTYILLSTAAPELKGLWGIAEVPGTKLPDGSINHTAGGGSESAVIFKDSQQKEASWEFLKWWTSADVQVRYGREMEAVLGADALWNTSNVDAIQKLPWPKEDLDALTKQWDSYKEAEVVPGGYYTSRYVVNAWNETVLQGKNPREALEDAAKEIDKELAKKRQEFGLPN